MILAPRKHLYATNIIFFCIIYILQKLIKLFCIIERKACSNINCVSPQRCDARCTINNNQHINNNTNKSTNNNNNTNATNATASSNNNYNNKNKNNNNNNNINSNNAAQKHGRTTDHALNGCVHVNTIRRNRLKRIAEVDVEEEREQQQQQIEVLPLPQRQRQLRQRQQQQQQQQRRQQMHAHCMPLVSAGGGVLPPIQQRRSMLLRMFGYGEGHYQLFVEDKQRKEPSKACLNAAVAELKLNPN